MNKKLKHSIISTSLAFTIYTISIVMFGLMSAPKSSDVAVVLGNEVEVGGNPSARLKARLDAAVSLYQNQLVKKIIVSGGVGKSGYNEAEVMARYLMEQNIDKENIIEDRQGNNTMATAINTADLAKKHNFRTIVIVSQYFHLPRCMLAFKKAGLKNFSASYPGYFEIRDIFSIIRETVAIPKYLFI